MNILFLSAQLASHLDWGGILATAQELKRRGHRTTWISGEAVRSPLETACVDFVPVAETGWRWPPPRPMQPDPTLDKAHQTFQRQVRALDQWLEPARVLRACELLRPQIEQIDPDLIVSEMFMAAGALVAESLRRPFVVAGWPAPTDRAVAEPWPAILKVSRQRLNAILAHLQLQGSNWTQQGPPALCSPHRHISYWSAGWFAGIAQGKQTRHVGGIAPPNSHQPLPADFPSRDSKPWVFITLGTTFNNDPAFFVNAAQAADRLGCQPILALGQEGNEELRALVRHRLPDSVYMTSVVDFGAVLPDTTVAIHHGGAGTTHALVTHGVPQIVVPHAADQGRQARAVARTGVGYHMAPVQATIANLERALANLLPDRSTHRAQAVLVQQEFAALGGSGAAADYLEAVVHQV